MLINESLIMSLSKFISKKKGNNDLSLTIELVKFSNSFDSFRSILKINSSFLFTEDELHMNRLYKKLWETKIDKFRVRKLGEKNST